MSTEADLWWRKVWKEHYQEQYKSSFEKFSASFLKNSDAEEEFKLKSGNKDEMKQLISNKEEKLAEVTEKNKFFKSRQYFNSVAYCLKRLEKSAESEQDEK